MIGPLFVSYCDGRPLISACANIGVDQSNGAPLAARGPWGPHGPLVFLLGPWCLYCDGRPLNFVSYLVWIRAMVHRWLPGATCGPWCLYRDGRHLNNLWAMFGVNKSNGAPVAARSPWGPHGPPTVSMVKSAEQCLCQYWCGSEQWCASGSKGLLHGVMGRWCSYRAPGVSNVIVDPWTLCQVWYGSEQCCTGGSKGTLGATWGPWCFYCDGRPLNNLCAMFGVDKSNSAPVKSRGPWGPHRAPGGHIGPLVFLSWWKTPEQSLCHVWCG